MIKIKNTLQTDSAKAENEDVINIKKALLKTGHYKMPDYGMTPYPDTKMFNAIKEFQKDNNLKIDGVIKPDGKTLEALNNTNRQTEDLPSKSPTMWCTNCGGPHGGSKGGLCPSCDAKS